METKRRSRWEPAWDGTELRGITERDLAIFRALYEHGPLSYDYLYEFTKEIASDLVGLKHRCAKLFHDRSSGHSEGYLLRPWQLNPQGVYAYKTIVENSLRAEAMLKGADLLAEAAQAKPGGPKPHQYMTSCITASFQIAIEAHPSIRYISRRTIVRNSPTKTLAIRAPITFNGQYYDKPYVPDGIFGVEYPDGGRFYFIVEADRRTEPMQRSGLETSSFVRKALQLNRVLGEGLYKEHFGLKAPMFCIIVTTQDEDKLVEMMEKTLKKAWFLLFTTAPEFRGFPRAPRVLVDLLDRPYHRAGHEDFIITSY